MSRINPFNFSNLYLDDLASILQLAEMGQVIQDYLLKPSVSLRRQFHVITYRFSLTNSLLLVINNLSI